MSVLAKIIKYFSKYNFTEDIRIRVWKRLGNNIDNDAEEALHVKIVKKNISKSQKNAMPNGIFCLKGGDIQAEVRPFKHIAQVTPISSFFSEEWFKEKNIIYLPL